MHDLYTSLVRDTVIPPLRRVRYTMRDDTIQDVHAHILESFAASGLASRLPAGGSVAVGVGSRGICRLPELVRAVIDWFKARGTHPFIVPCMGSHGGATAEGQRHILEALGITEASMGCPVRATMEVVRLGELPDLGLPVYMDKFAFEADSVFVINRVKLHTSFTGAHESGIVKMLTIGLGKQRSADSCHSLGYAHFAGIMPRMSALVLEKKPSVLGALAVVENAWDHPCHLEVVPRERLLERDAALLELSKKVMPALPIKHMDVLLVDRIGKNISGLGLDPNITGRFLTEFKSNDVRVGKAGVFDLTPETNGSAVGMGCVDAISARLRDKINFEYTYANVITSTVLKGAFMPLALPTDELVIRTLLKTCNAPAASLRLVRIRDTLSLGRLLVSDIVARELREHPDCEVLDEYALPFDAQGGLTDFDQWLEF